MQLLIAVLLLTTSIQGWVTESPNHISFGGKEVIGVGSPTLPDSATTKAYVDASSPSGCCGLTHLTTDMSCESTSAMVGDEFHCYLWGRSSESIGMIPIGSVEDETLFEVTLEAVGETTQGIVLFDERTKRFNVTIPATTLVGSGSIMVKYFNKVIVGSPYAVSLTEDVVDPSQSGLVCQTVAESCPIPENGGFSCTLTTKDRFGNPSSLGITNMEASMNEDEFGLLTRSFAEGSKGVWTTIFPGYLMGYQMEVKALVEVGAASDTIAINIDREPTLSSTNTWVEIATKPGTPSACYHTGLGCYGAWCYVFGGYSPATNKVDRYDLVCQNWQTLSTVSPTGISGGVRASVAKNGRMHIMGRIGDSDCSAAVDVFDTKEEQFVDTYAFPLHDGLGVGFGGHDCNENYCYHVGGYSCANGDPANSGTNVFWQFDRTDETWTDMPVPSPRITHGNSVFADEDAVYMYGSYGGGYTTYSDAFDIYNASLGIWSIGPNGNTLQNFGKMVKILGNVCAIGGVSASGIGMMEIHCWNPTSYLWTYLAPDLAACSYAGLFHHISVRTGGTMVFHFAGYNYGTTSRCDGKSYAIHYV